MELAEITKQIEEQGIQERDIVELTKWGKISSVGYFGKLKEPFCYRKSRLLDWSSGKMTSAKYSGDAPHLLMSTEKPQNPDKSSEYNKHFLTDIIDIRKVG